MGKNDHIDATEKNKAILDRNGKYRENGWNKINGESGKKNVYSNLTNIQSGLSKLKIKAIGKIESGSQAHARRYVFKYKNTMGKNNFKYGYLPYINQAHHLIPVEIFSGDSKREVFTDDQLIVMKKVLYDINNGGNIMFLPQKDTRTEIHNIPSHSGAHSKYTDAVEADMSEVSDKLQKAVKKDKPHEEWDPPNDIVGTLEDLQNKYWKDLKNAGPSKISAFEKPTKKRKTKKK